MSAIAPTPHPGPSAARGLIALLLAALSACATQVPPEPPPAPASLVHDELFPPSQETIHPDQVMALSPRMQAFVDTRLRSTGYRARDMRDTLLDALYTKGDLRLDYDAELTRTPAEAFDAKSGNCLSLAMMTASFARAIGVPVTFRHIYQEEQWSRVGDLQVVSGHVNIALDRRLTPDYAVIAESSTLVVDFLPGAQIRSQRAVTIDERTIVAMYMNNRAAEWMTQAQLDRAYWWARAAWLHQPRMLSALNTLGVVYRRHGDLVPAERAFRAVLISEPGNVQAMSNLAQLLRLTGKIEEAQQWEARLHALQPYPPFKFYDMGVAAMKAGDFMRARDLFAKEIDRSAYNPDFHFWMAMANAGLARWDEVRQSLSKAEELSTTVRDRQLYAAKLASLKAKMAR